MKYKVEVIEKDQLEKYWEPITLIWVNLKLFIVYRDFYHHQPGVDFFGDIPAAYLLNKTGQKGQVLKIRPNGTLPHWNRNYHELVLVELDALIKGLENIIEGKCSDELWSRIKRKNKTPDLLDRLVLFDLQIKRYLEITEKQAEKIGIRLGSYELDGEVVEKEYDPKRDSFARHKTKYKWKKKTPPPTKEKVVEPATVPAQNSLEELSIRTKAIRKEQSRLAGDVFEILRKLDERVGAIEEQPKGQDHKQALVAAYALLWSAPVLLLLYQLLG